MAPMLYTVCYKEMPAGMIPEPARLSPTMISGLEVQAFVAGPPVPKQLEMLAWATKAPPTLTFQAAFQVLRYGGVAQRRKALVCFVPGLKMDVLAEPRKEGTGPPGNQLAAGL